MDKFFFLLDFASSNTIFVDEKLVFTTTASSSAIFFHPMMLPCYGLHWSPKYLPKTSPFPLWLEDRSHQSVFFFHLTVKMARIFFKDLILGK